MDKLAIKFFCVNENDFFFLNQNICFVDESAQYRNFFLCKFLWNVLFNVYHSTFISKLYNNVDPRSLVDHSNSLLLNLESIWSFAPIVCGPTL